MSAFYPDGFDGASVQMMAYFSEGAGGFYIACHDRTPPASRSGFRPWKRGSTTRTGGPAARHACRVRLPIVIAPLVRGDWHEAVERYRAWALEHAPWARGVPDCDGARWLREEVGLSIWGTPSSIHWSPWYHMYADELGMPLHIVPGWDWAAELPPTRGREAGFRRASTRRT